MQFIDSVLAGPFRFLLLFTGILFVHQMVTRQPTKTFDLDYILKRLVFHGSLILIVIFVLVQMNMYDIFSLLIIFFVVLGLQYLELGNLKNPQKQIRKKRRYFLLGFFKLMEQNLSTKKILENNLKIFHIKKFDFVFAMAFICALAVFISRYLFLKKDMYTLSGLWSKNLEIVKGFSNNVWFMNESGLIGEQALINFYGKITGISGEMAIHSFGLIEIFILCFVLYGILANITKSKFFAPIVGVLFFAFFYKFLPININLLLEHNSLYLALYFALSAMMFTVIPDYLIVSKRNYFFVMLVIFIAIAFINFFVSFFVLPIFLILALLLNTKKTRGFIVRSAMAYILGTGITLIIHAIGTYSLNISFKSFLRENLMLVGSYTHFPQLIYPIDQMLLGYLVFSVLTLLCVLPLYLKNKGKWTPAMVFSILVLVFVFLKDISITWIDKDLYYQTISVLLVIQVGIFIGTLEKYSQISIPKRPIVRAFSLLALFVVMGLIAFSSNGLYKNDTQNIDELKTDVIKIYHTLASDYLPYSYAVVNKEYGQNMSKNKHHFINYTDFLENYVRRDSIYHLNKDNTEFLDQNPDYILSHSVFIFITKKDEMETIYNLSTPGEVSKELISQLNILKGRGRNINLFYDDDYLAVYEIVNREKSSKLNDLIFNL